MEYHSSYGGLWTDSIDAINYCNKLHEEQKINNQEKEDLLFWIENGYLIKRNIIPSDFIDEMQKEIDSTIKRGLVKATFFEKKGKKNIEFSSPENILKKEAKVLDIYTKSLNVQKAVFHKKISRFLNILFDGPGLAFQNLYFQRGSQQNLHQDTAFVYVDSPLEFVASWIALEDVNTNSGPLLFSPKSHRLPDNLGSSGTKELLPGDKLKGKNQENLKNQIKENGLALDEFIAQKGDVLFWAADLIHGGKKVEDLSSTRKSLVTHYCPKNRIPKYMKNKQVKNEIDLICGNRIISKN